METKQKELVIIGAGPGGYRAAFMAADLGLKVSLIDPEKNPGGFVFTVDAFLLKHCCIWHK